jgi:hypothetical protein
MSGAPGSASDRAQCRSAVPKHLGEIILMEALMFKAEDGLGMAAPAAATAKGNPFLTGLDYTHAPSERSGVFEEVE